MKAIYRKRLERLAQLLENWSVEKKFLVAPEGREKVNKFDIEIWKCGTAACALGSACMLPEFNKAGLKLDGAALPAYKGYSESVAGAEFFGLDYDEACLLFMPWNYKDNPTPKTVAKRVREILAGKA